MIEKLSYIYSSICNEKSKIDLDKIIKQRSSSYLKFKIHDQDPILTKFDIYELTENKLIANIDNEEYIILPLGYTLLESGFTDYNENVEYMLLQKIYNIQCKQLVNTLQVDNKLSSLECALGFFILLNGCTSRESGFPFIKYEDSYRFIEIIRSAINELSFRLFYNSSDVIIKLRDHIHLRNLLGRNNKNGTLRKLTGLHNIGTDKGNGITLHWFDIEDEKGKVDCNKINGVLDKMLSKNMDIITLINIKKIALDYSLVNLLPYELKSIMGMQACRGEVLQMIISYVNSSIHKLIDIDNSNLNEILKEKLNSLDLNPSSDFHQVLNMYNLITDIINTNPEIGVFLIEIHYRLAKVVMYKQLPEEFRLDIEDEDIIIENFKLYDLIDIIGDDFFDLFSENKTLCLNFPNI